MRTGKLLKKVQNRINKKVAESSKHFSSEPMDKQIEALIEVIAPLINHKNNILKGTEMKNIENDLYESIAVLIFDKSAKEVSENERKLTKSACYYLFYKGECS